MMVRWPKMRDKVEQQRRRRSHGAVRSTADRRPMGEDRSFAAETSQVPAPWPATSEGSQGPRRDSLDSAQRRSLAGFAGRIPLAGNVLAEASRLGGAGRLVEHLAGVSERTQRAPAIEMERIVSG